MNVKIYPSRPEGRVKAPPSKSDAHRQLVCAGLAAGESSISGTALSEDIKATLGCLEALGASCRITGDDIIADGTGFMSEPGKNSIFCNECGTTIRFFIPLCLLSGEEFTVTGSRKLLARPMSVYEDICREQGLKFENDGEKITMKGPLSPGEYKIKGNISSQFISGLLFALPLLNGDSTIRIIPPFESRPYVDMTLSVLENSGIVIKKTDPVTFEIPGGQKYKPTDRTVEGDWSNAAFLYALREMGDNIEIEGLNDHSLQGDRRCVEFLGSLKNGRPVIDLADCPDLAPMLFTFAGMHNGAEFIGTARLKIKESDRIGEMAAELKKCGIILIEKDNEVTVENGGFHAPSEPLCGHNDHRIVMALAVMLTRTGGTITGAEAVKKSWPDFFETLEKAGVKTEYEA